MKFLKSFKEANQKDLDRKSIDDYIEMLSTMPEGEEKERRKEELGANMFGPWMPPEENIDSKKFNDPNWDDYVWDGDNYKYKPKNSTKYTVSDFAISTSGDDGWGFGSRKNRKDRKRDRNRLADDTPTFEAHPFAGQYVSNYEEDKRKLFSEDEYNQLVADLDEEDRRKKGKIEYFDSGHIVTSLDDYNYSYKSRKKTREELAKSTPTFESKQEN